MPAGTIIAHIMASIDGDQGCAAAITKLGGIVVIAFGTA